VFLFAFHEVTMSALLYGPGSRTLGVVVLNLQELGDVGRTSALAVVMVAVAVASALAMLAAWRTGRRLIDGRRA
jgi:iron(III) transport system permease protein